MVLDFPTDIWKNYDLIVVIKYVSDMEVLWLISNDHLSSVLRSRVKSESLSLIVKMSP